MPHVPPRQQQHVKCTVCATKVGMLPRWKQTQEQPILSFKSVRFILLLIVLSRFYLTVRIQAQTVTGPSRPILSESVFTSAHCWGARIIAHSDRTFTSCQTPKDLIPVQIWLQTKDTTLQNQNIQILIFKLSGILMIPVFEGLAFVSLLCIVVSFQFFCNWNSNQILRESPSLKRSSKISEAQTLLAFSSLSRTRHTS